MNPAFRSLLWYLLVGTRGGPNRCRIVELLHRSPANAHQVASALELDYRTVRHHLRLLEQNQVVTRSVPGAYAPPYELSPYLAEQFEAVAELIHPPAPAPERRRRSPAPAPGWGTRSAIGGP
ncbi:MAG TPA: winged helix-turn-helix domain-containing protein [Thermoplasmata archaeon]|nr:winged helix-turn-helix domain-containing protein [Thermoplasmata archaeon]HUJ77668.1 winged helix-turn-helix domain-containing protein [Thermoplasmata archaeon]